MNWVDTGPSNTPIGTEEQVRSRIGSLQMLSLVIGIAAMAITLGVAFISEPMREPFFRAYLYAYFFWTGLTLGCGGIAMIHNLTAGRWGQAARRVIEAANGNMVLMAILGIPLVVAVYTHHLYGWAGSPYMPQTKLGAHKAQWLQPNFVVVRAVVAMVIWIATSFMIRIGARRVEATRSFAVARPFAAASAVGLILYILPMTAVVVDWAMSLTPEWYSTMFTLIFMMGQMLSAFSFTVLVTALLIRYRPAAGKVSKDQFNDLASFMFAFTVLWAYMSFAQLIISWMGNLKAEMTWYAHRNVGVWLVIGLSLMIVQFTIPFLLLLNKNLKRNPNMLIWVALLIIVMRFVDLLYLFKPAFPDQRMSWMDALTPFAIGGLFMWGFFGRLKAGKLDPPPLVNEYTAAEVSAGHGVLGATDYGAAISHRKGPVP